MKIRLFTHCHIQFSQMSTLLKIATLFKNGQNCIFSKNKMQFYNIVAEHQILIV